MNNKNNSGKRNSGNYNSGDWNSGDYNSGGCNSGDSNSGHYNSGHNNSGNWNSGTWNSGYYNSGECNSGHSNSGHWNSGYCNSGSWNSGFFNTDTPTVRCFNKETGIQIEDFEFPNMDGFQLTEYKDDKLVTYEYQKAWKNFWAQLDDNRKSEFLNLPNFDSKIFEEITGIKTSEKENKQNDLKRLEFLISKTEEYNKEIQLLKLKLL